MNSPFKWVGGKSRLRKHIVPLLPEHTCYVEPFAGAAWVLFGKSPSAVEVLNDLDEDLISFFRVVRERPEDFIQTFDLALVSRAEFERLAQANTLEMTDLERAHRFYYIIMAAWGGELNYPRFATSISDGGGGNRLLGALRTLRERIEPVHRRLSSVIIERLPWQECIERYDKPGVCMYVDPPYPGNGCNYRHNIRGWEEHKALASRLAQSRCHWIYSSYDMPEVRELFPAGHFIPVTSASGMRVAKDNHSRVQNKEVLITNFIPGASSILPRQRSTPEPLFQLTLE